jgi:hypothetical protein
MLRRIIFTVMAPRRAALIGAFMFAGVFALLPSSVGAQECQEGICLHTSSKWVGKKPVKVIYFTGNPRTPQGYVTNFYQIRGLPWSVTHEGQIESKTGGPYEFEGSATIGIQSCRRRGPLIHTICTSWVSFKVY